MKLKKPIKEKTRTSRVKQFINNCKYLYNKKYYKNNYIVMAHFESWVCRGLCGKCCCCYNEIPSGSIHNKRISHKLTREAHQGNICDLCLDEIECQINTTFKKIYCK